MIDAYSEPVPYFWVKKPGVWGSLGETSHPSVLTGKLKVEKSCRTSGSKRIPEMHECSKTKGRIFCHGQGNFHCLDLILCIEETEGLLDTVPWKVTT